MANLVIQPTGNTPFTNLSFWNSLYPQSQYKDRTAFALHFLLALNQPEKTVAAYITKLNTENRARLFHKDPLNHNLTPLHIAAMKANQAAVERLLSHAKDNRERRQMLNQQDAFGFTPLHMAALTSEHLYRYFLEQGADPSLKTLSGGTAEHLLPLCGRVRVLNSTDTLFFEDPLSSEVKRAIDLTAHEKERLFPPGFTHTDTPLYAPEMVHRLWLDTQEPIQKAFPNLVARFRKAPPRLLVRNSAELAEIDNAKELVAMQAIREGEIISEYTGLRTELVKPTGFKEAYLTNSRKYAYATQEFDSKDAGNESRFANSGFPNALIASYHFEGSLHSYLIATKPIKKDEAIVWDYGITMTHLAFGKQILLNKTDMLEFFRGKTGHNWRAETIADFMMIANSRNSEESLSRIHSSAALQNRYVFPLTNPTALLYLFFNEAVPLDLWTTKEIQNPFLDQFQRENPFEWNTLECIFETLQNVLQQAKSSHPEVKALFYQWVLGHLERIPLIDLLKGIEKVLESDLSSKNTATLSTLLDEANQFLEGYDWLQDPLYPFHLERRARLLFKNFDFLTPKEKVAELKPLLGEIKTNLGSNYELSETYQVMKRVLELAKEEALVK
ncbi:ankyrin repeat domain-containing protein [Estrella lausannensis]|uniref:SET domain-containing protein n=1 Tax=Estrella lausannensis TaxID=483423 RepID=A0A0H5DRM5_9BACT|nr:ankyrin repeat domain-containing protein [Estrella lausannensis]CRX38359.1 hypothetical protein ELAC_1014 [Estrella lausannensis]